MKILRHFLATEHRKPNTKVVRMRERRFEYLKKELHLFYPFLKDLPKAEQLDFFLYLLELSLKEKLGTAYNQSWE